MSTENYLLDRPKNITGFFYIDHRRIDWIDLAKGIAILLVIIGHTVMFGSMARNLIFSFHMPLFFVLSGYTYKFAENKQEFWIHVRKGIRHLILPAILLSVITVFTPWVMGSKHSLLSLWMGTQRVGEAFLWASGVKVNSHPGLGAMWFLISLFWAKIIIDGIHLLFPGENDGYLYTFVGIFGVFLGIRGMWLPQNFDVTCVAVFFMYLGTLWKKYAEKIKEHEKVTFFCAVAFWLTCLHFNIYIELATRHYPYLAVSVVEAVCGAYAFCCFCKGLATNRAVTLGWQFIGMHTMLIYGLHCLDWISSPLWNSPVLWKAAFLRVLILLIAGLVIYSVQYIWKRWKLNFKCRLT
ncbi:acyltransferase family protein [Megasphaera sp.]|uniref:acyltransferase family protein n=1 Tax=Megasphaera sp. TaxID=2023260 RepID=UPI0027B8F8D7|nr:acyltransferase [Megasphaera sp.]